jgi:general secretion pathway protein F
MALYRYQAVTASGQLVSGEMEAASQAAVVERLQNDGHVPIRADESADSAWRRALTQPLFVSAGRRIGNLALITQQLALLLHAGLPLDRALEITASILQKRDRAEIEAVLDSIRSGSSLADAMASRGATFPRFYVGMVRAGETSGSLEATLRHLGDFLEKSQNAREQVKSALTYPLIVLATGTASVAVLFGFVVPRFRPLFDEAGAKLPFSAQVVLAISDIVQDYWWALLALPVLLGCGLILYLRRPAGRLAWDRLMLRLPVIGDLATKLEIGRFSRTLGTMLKNGVTPLAALAITAETLRNAAVRQAIASVADRVKEGAGFSEPLAATGVVPVLALRLIRVGEETARLDDMLLKVADIYDQEGRRTVDRLLAMLVPAMTIGLGVVVALVIGSILTAVLSVYELAV